MCKWLSWFVRRGWTFVLNRGCCGGGFGLQTWLSDFKSIIEIVYYVKMCERATAAIQIDVLSSDDSTALKTL
jgi:hypothetical protein